MNLVDSINKCSDIETFIKVLSTSSYKGSVEDFSQKIKELYFNKGELPNIETVKILRFFDEISK